RPVEQHGVQAGRAPLGGRVRAIEHTERYRALGRGQEEPDLRAAEADRVRAPRRYPQRAGRAEEPVSAELGEVESMALAGAELARGTPRGQLGHPSQQIVRKQLADPTSERRTLDGVDGLDTIPCFSF